MTVSIARFFYWLSALFNDVAEFFKGRRVYDPTSS